MEDSVRKISVDLHVDLGFKKAKQGAVEHIEQALVNAFLERSRGNIAAAARAARMDRSNFRRLMNRHRIDASRFQMGARNNAGTDGDERGRCES